MGYSKKIKEDAAVFAKEQGITLKEALPKVVALQKSEAALTHSVQNNNKKDELVWRDINVVTNKIFFPSGEVFERSGRMHLKDAKGDMHTGVIARAKQYFKNHAYEVYPGDVVVEGLDGEHLSGITHYEWFE